MKYVRLVIGAVLLSLAAHPLSAEVRSCNTIVIAASNSSKADKKSADLKCTGTGDQKVLQQAVNMLVFDNGDLTRKGGTVVLLPGDYWFDSFESETYDGNSTKGRASVLLPSRKIGSEVISISVRGAERNTECSVIHLSRKGYDALDDVTTYSLFASERLASYCHYSFSDMKVTIPGGQKNIICFDGRQMGSMECRRIKCVVSGYSGCWTPTDKIKLPVEGCIAFCGCYYNSNSWNYIWESNYAFGFGQGFACGGEHLLAVKCVGAFGLYGFTFSNYYERDSVKDNRGVSTNSRHTNTLIDCTDEANANFWKFAANSGNQTINVYNLNLEYWPTWFAIEGQGRLATEEVPGQYNGVLNYTMNRGGGTIPNVHDRFWAEGSGHGFRSVNNVQKQVCTSAERRSYSPNIGQILFDTDLNKMLVCTDPDRRVWVDFDGNEVE